MKKTERKSVDIRVAMTSKAKTASSEPSSWAQGGFGQPASPATAVISSGRIEAAPGSSALKQLVRRVARSAYRILKPFMRPVAFRVRAYLAAPLQQNVEAQNQVIAQQLETFRRQQRALLEHNTSQLLQEIQAMRESLGRSQGQRAPDAQLGRIEGYSYASARRVVIPCGPNEVMVRTAVGYVLCAASDYALISSLVETGELEGGTRVLIQKLMSPGGTFVDVGANIGMHTLAAAIAMRGQGRIVAFEPLPSTHDLMRKSVWMNGYSAIAETHQAAVSNRSGSQPLFLGATSGHHSLYRLESPTVPVPPPVEVPLVRLDEVLGANARVDVIKIDVEGAELEVLESARSLIEGNTGIALIVEFGFSHLQRTGYTTAAWLKPFEEIGLRYRAIDAASGQLLDWPAERLEEVASINLLFARPESAAWALAGSAH
jgi:FkbM family methyltransferase